jgi:hypothetical protein
MRPKVAEYASRISCVNQPRVDLLGVELLKEEFEQLKLRSSLRTLKVIGDCKVSKGSPNLQFARRMDGSG